MIIIREMRQADVESVMAIETVVCEFPWTYGIYSDCIKVGYSCWVLEDEGGHEPEIVGYGLFSMAANEAHILQLCIKPDRQRQGLGRRMMKHLLETAKNSGASSVYLEVRLSNHGAFDLYQSLGFTVIGHRKDYYPATNGREDAIVLELSFKEHPSPV